MLPVRPTPLSSKCVLWDMLEASRTWHVLLRNKSFGVCAVKRTPNAHTEELRGLERLNSEFGSSPSIGYVHLEIGYARRTRV